MKWTKTSVDYLQEHYANSSIVELCKELNRTPNQIYKKAYILNLKKNVLPDISRDDLYQDYVVNRLSVKALSIKHDTSIEAMIKLLRTLGLKQ